MNNEDKDLFEDDSYDNDPEEQNVNYTDNNDNSDNNDYNQDYDNDSYNDDYDNNDDYGNDSDNNSNDIYALPDDDSDNSYSSYYSDDKDSSSTKRNAKMILYGVVAVIVLIIGFFLYTNFFATSTSKKAEARKVTMAAGDKLNLNYNSDSYSWNSSNKDVAIITEDGQIEALKEGDATLTIRIDNSTYTINVHVEGSSIVITQVDIDKDEIVLKIDDEYQLKASVLPEDAKNTELVWHSSNEKAVEVDSTGKVKAKAIGTSTIMAKSGNGNLDVCIVRVTSSEEDEEFDDIVFDVSSIVLKEDVKYTLDYSIEPKGAKVKLNWESSDPSVATVEDGIIKTKSSGSVAITARKANKEATLYVTVVKGDSSTPDVINDGKGPKAVSINVNQTELNMKLGSTFKLVSEVLPTNTADKTVTYRSENESIATVDGVGTVTALALGETKITATAASGVSTDIKILVTEQGGTNSIESITLSITNVTLSPGNELQLVGTYSPSNANPKELIWESSDTNVVTVENGLITALSSGTAKITVSNGSGVSASCNITVSSSTQTISNITISPASLSLKVNGSTQLSVNFFPANASNKTLVWSSSNRTIATVDANGLVYGKKKGQAVIFATTSNGIVGTALVTVE